ncbi:hypothetical protein LXA43DRAFT_974693 [Ganoderma leucocontextum]|nr:hypothetical protein LXA43DRAFT_974693 [Ganoderma leucocontextum]
MNGQPTTGVASCPVDKFVPTFPSGQNQLVAPSGPTKFLGLAFGVQNYTCSSSNNYTSTGAVAELLDASCMASEPSFSTIQDDLYQIWNTVIPQPIQAIIELLHYLNPPTILAQHFFQTNPVTGQGVSPVWDFRSNPRFKGKDDAYILGRGNGSIPSPQDSKKDVAWLHVVNVQGHMADEVFRFDTVGGQPPAACTYGTDKDISVKYVSKYIFYGGSINCD